MNFLEKLKSIFFRKKTKYLTSGVDVNKILQLAKKEITVIHYLLQK